MSQKKQACTARTYEITKEELPLSCPAREMRVWDAHPRVYLAIEALGEVTCPYCAAHFVLKDFTPPSPKEKTEAQTEGY